jgi:hypothetical protein
MEIKVTGLKHGTSLLLESIGQIYSCVTANVRPEVIKYRKKKKGKKKLAQQLKFGPQYTR